ncbi:MAG: hypothetical protein KJO52_14695 [Maribacter sp.]|nr:hypothetical protein [Maribacter sp.]MBT8300959.1 hypothetical protein [Maribacter sp.]NNK17754.1 hypothetical protein [Maribacter sp.]
MRRALSILAVVAMTVGLFVTTTENEIQEQEVITCDDCSHEKDDRGNSLYSDTLACDDCSHEKDDRGNS